MGGLRVVVDPVFQTRTSASSGTSCRSSRVEHRDASAFRSVGQPKSGTGVGQSQTKARLTRGVIKTQSPEGVVEITNAVVASGQHVNISGGEFQVFTVADFFQLSGGNEGFDFLLGLAEFGAGFLEAVEHVGHGVDLLTVPFE